ncbi:MAG: Peptidoglycan glycosyltransferase [Candidatus Curtissbacteria bacterium GW2011_GWC2_38_9]|uniref:Penicillin-binding protein transpeptidase domain-containing protein n=3 Tax=Candidatus Curtissiibacteriota TaxID=1752717 RepID=A0A1F5HQT6_9BACT|nr:MAG: Peptidoglycan glycosyltransferase [Candidatus Curtissbacteria bacterium GW2011_GWC2_38_9]KKS03536.1 MAG: Peptidoglycan glycosyltransferase [Candidatus Curtissbacteria bacterium GW2011_GWA2_41_24]OGE06450.1 MAG: hypothetical protein A2W70_01130 [Candidatus Curtissbacteria bacterium RIFCSPLOWO2_02_41_11]
MDRIKAVQIFIFVIAIMIVARLFYWQFIAKVQGNFESIISEDNLPAARGEIYDSQDFPLVTNQEAFLIYGKPHDLKQSPKDIAQKIAPYLISEKYATASAGLSEDEQKAKDAEIKTKEEELTNRLATKTLFWVQLSRKITKDAKEKIQAMNIAGLGFEADQKRFYPESSMAAQLLGFVGSDKFGVDTGYYGLEGYWDRRLRGKSGRLGQETDPFGFPILVGKYRPIEPQKGASLYLTLDRSIQFMVERSLKQAVEKYGARDGTVIVADPKTGGILSMATYPTYNPAVWQEFDEKFYKNPAVADTFEPGSIFKIVVMSTALDVSVVEPITRCDVCSGPRQIGGYEISTWNKKYYPNSTMTEIIQHSDNVGMTFVSEKLGIDKFYDYIKKFGFGQRTDIDLQEESTGYVREKKDWKVIDLATASFGQGIAVTPIQMVEAVLIIANKGKLLTLHLVDKIVDGQKEEKVKAQGERQVISPKTAAQMTEMMVNAVENGEARAFAPKGYRIAGKTGTAQIPVAGHYDPNKTIASFVGFAPADDPRFVMMVRFSEPSSSPFGSETAAPTFFGIAKELFNYYGIAPKR